VGTGHLSILLAEALYAKGYVFDRLKYLSPWDVLPSRRGKLQGSVVKCTVM
jgi:hypothetical protein